jgi:hypothetical protein
MMFVQIVIARLLLAAVIAFNLLGLYETRHWEDRSTSRPRWLMTITVLLALAAQTALVVVLK